MRSLRRCATAVMVVMAWIGIGWAAQGAVGAQGVEPSAMDEAFYTALGELVQGQIQQAYERLDRASDSDYGNLDRDAAIQEWEDKLALVEISTHASTGHIGWYVGTYKTEGAVPGKEQELYDSAHRQSYYATDRITDQDLDDVFVFIAGGCDTYGEPEKEGKESIPTVLKNRGVDTVLSWDKSQYPARHLWVKYFLEKSFEKEGGQYRTMLAAAQKARDELVDDFDQDTANYVYDNLKWDGKVANPQDQKLFPPRYGRKDN